MKKKSMNKLSLHIETVRHLTADQTRTIKAGLANTAFGCEHDTQLANGCGVATYTCSRCYTCG